MRMLMNNLDPEVAEHPDQLIVYGGSGRAARSWDAYAAIVAHPARPQGRRNPAGPVGQAGRGAANPRMGPAGADRQLQPGPAVGDLGGVPAAGAPRPDHVRPDDGGFLDLHRHPGHPAGHLRDVRRDRGQAVRRHPGRHDHADRRPGRDGRRPAAGRDHERRRGHLRRAATRPASPGGSSTATWTSRPTTSTTPSAGRRRQATRASRCPSACSATPPTCSRPCWPAARPSTSSPTRPRPTTRSPTCPGASPSRTWPRCAPKTRPASPPAPASRWPRRSPPWSASSTPAPRSSTTATPSAARPSWPGTPGPSTSPASCPAYIRPLFCEGKGPFRWAALSGDPKDIAATDQAILDLFPQNEALARWIRLAGEKVHFQGLPARICWLGYGERHLAGLRFNELVASGDLAGPHRARPRPPGLRLGRLAVPGDRGAWPTARTRSPTGRC